MKVIKNKSKSLLIALLWISVLALAAGCTNFLEAQIDDETVEKQNQSKISFSFEDFARSAFPTVQVSELTDFELYSKQVQEEDYSLLKQWADYPAVKNDIIEISPGTYDFMMKAKCSGLWYKAETTEKVIKLGVNKVNFTFELSGVFAPEGNGAFEISLQYPNSGNVKIVTASLFTKDDIPVVDYQDKELSLNAGKTSFVVQNIAGGTYHIVFKLYYDLQCKTLLATCQETAIVIDEHTSTSSVAVTELNPVYTIRYVLNGLEWKSNFTPFTSCTRLSDKMMLPTCSDLNIEDSAIFLDGILPVVFLKIQKWNR